MRAWTGWAVLAALLLGVGATGWGLWVHGRAIFNPLWTPHHWQQAQAVLGIGAAILAAGLLAARPAVTLGGVVAVAGVAFGAGAVAAVALVALAALLLGRAVLRLLDRGHEPGALLSLPAGVALLAMALPVVGMLGLPVRGAMWGALALAGGLLLWRPGARAAVAALGAALLARGRPEPARWPALWLITAWVVFALAHAALPERGFDAFAVHRLVTNQIVTFGAWGHGPAEMIFALFPLGANHLYAFAELLGGEAAASLLNVALLLGTLLLLRDMLRDVAGPLLRDLGLLLLLATPVVLGYSATLFIENALTFLATAAARTLLRAEGPAARQALAALVLILPGMAAMKLHGAIIATAALPIALWRLWAARPPARFWAGLAGMSALAAPLGAAPYIHAWIVSGNPVLPFMNNVFRSPLWPPTAFEDPRWVGKLTPDILYEMTFRTSAFVEGFPGALGVAVLALSLAGVVATALAPRRAAWIALAVALPPVAFVLLQTQYLRYVHFALPLLAVAMTHALAEIGRRLGPLAGVPAAAAGWAAVGGGFLLLPAGFWTVLTADLRGTYDPVARHAIAMQTPARQANEVLNAFVGTRPRVLYGSPGYGANLRGWPIYSSWYNQRVAHGLEGAATPAEVDAVLDPLRAAFVVAQVPPADPNEAKLVEWADRRGAPMAVLGQVRVWALRP